MPLFEPIPYLAESTSAAILGLPAQGYSFLGDEAGADSITWFESTKKTPLGHVFLLLYARGITHPSSE
jgi:hypothetical protein